ncbi:retrovirus-related pol polyprotein from transposon TNT 1-94 [Tanacetum coccineum]
MCHIIGIEPQFENIIKNGSYIPMAAGQRKLEVQWLADERNVANLDQRLKSLIISVLPDDQMNSVINCLTAKSTWDDLILYREGLSDVKESKDFQDSPDDEDDARSSQEYMNDLEEEYQGRSLLAKSRRFFKKGTQRFSGAKATDQTECNKCGGKGHFTRDCFSKTLVPSYQSPFQTKLLHSSKHKLELKHTNDFEAKYNKVKAKLALLSSSALAPKSSSGKNKGLIAKTYEWDEEEMSLDEETEVKALMELADEERDSVGKESANNGEWVKISIQKVHTLLEIEDNDDRKSFLDYLCIDLNYVEEQRNNLLSKHINLVQELNTCKEQLLVLKQAKLDFFTMQHVNTEMFKENQNLRNELKDLTSITETWLNSSNKVNQCISEQIPTQKKKILGIDQLTEDTSSSRQKDLIFIKSSVDNSNMSITTSNKPRLFEAENSTLPNHDTDKVPSEESERNTIDLSVAISDSSVTDYDSADESSVYSTPLPPLEKLAGAEPVYGPKTIKSILKSNSTFKVEILKSVIINEPSSAPAKGNISILVSKTNAAPAGKLKNVKIEDGPPLAIVMKELKELKLQISKDKSSYSRNKNSIQCKRTDHRTCDHVEFMSSMKIHQHHTGQGESSSRSRSLSYVEAMIMILMVIAGLFLYEEESNLETLNMSQRTVKHVVAMFLPQLITMTLSGLEKERLPKLRKLRLLKQVNLNHQDQDSTKRIKVEKKVSVLHSMTTENAFNN